MFSHKLKFYWVKNLNFQLSSLEKNTDFVSKALGYINDGHEFANGMSTFFIILVLLDRCLVVWLFGLRMSKAKWH